MGTLEANTTLIYGVHIRESANDGSDFTAGASDYRVLFLGEDGRLHDKDSSSVVRYTTVSTVDYVEITAAVNITSTTEATPTTLITGNAVTYNGSQTVDIEVYAPFISSPSNAAGQNSVILLYDGSSSIGRLAYCSCSVAGQATRFPLFATRRLTPSAASHTYSIRGFASHATGGSIDAGAGGSGASMPAFIRIRSV